MNSKPVQECSVCFYLSLYDSFSVITGIIHKLELPQTEWLKTKDIFSFILLEARSLKSRVSRAVLPLESLRENPSLPPLASGGPHMFPDLQLQYSDIPHLHMASSSTSVCSPLLCFVRTFGVWI